MYSSATVRVKLQVGFLVTGRSTLIVLRLCHSRVLYLFMAAIVQRLQKHSYACIDSLYYNSFASKFN